MLPSGRIGRIPYDRSHAMHFEVGELTIMAGISPAGAHLNPHMRPVLYFKIRDPNVMRTIPDVDDTLIKRQTYPIHVDAAYDNVLICRVGKTNAAVHPHRLARISRYGD